MRNDITEDYPSSWNKEEFKNITSFQQKMNYANQRLEKLATGSGRAVFKIDEQKVLKIAKNKKGLAQNNIESEPHTQNYDITAHTYDIGEIVKDIGPFWVEMELVKKLTPSKFKQLTGLTHITYSNYLFYLSLKNRFKSKDYELDVFSNRREIENNQFVQDIIRFADDYDMVYGDLRRLSSYGVVYRAGNEKIVLVDYGLTTQVHDDYYKVKF